MKHGRVTEASFVAYGTFLWTICIDLKEAGFFSRGIRDCGEAAWSLVFQRSEMDLGGVAEQISKVEEWMRERPGWVS